jgi:hypothetical protein
MRLLRRKENGRFEHTGDLREEALPNYAILSHTWQANEDEEASFEDLMQGNIEAKSAGYDKLRFCADQAAKDGLEYFWVDTCCIKRESSTELQEAITTMFTWYRNADRCYAYLTDVSINSAPEVETNTQAYSHSWESAFRRSKWFKRGWTLQELLAPTSVEFFSAEGVRLGDKKSLEQCIHEITAIPHQALRGDALSNFSVSERLSWAETRQTKRKEDKAYCLLGIFNVFMPLMYGEGGDNAFTRLRKEINNKHPENAKLDGLLSLLPIASEAAFDSLNNQHEPTCLPNTRVELLQDISQWSDGLDDKSIFLLNGIAGTGKSTVARTVAGLCHERGTLGASFFFSRGGGDLSNANRFVTTIAKQLATRIPPVRRYICEAIDEQKDIVDHSLREFGDQWHQLIMRPLSKIRSNSVPSTVVLVIDALDECESERGLQAILRALVDVSSFSNVRLRIFITSRPKLAIRHSIMQIPDRERQESILHEIPTSLVERDLAIFFENNFSIIRKECGFDTDWPDMHIISRLVEISCGLFIWASTACRFIREDKRFTMRRIKVLINGHRSGENQLDQIYTTVLQDSIRQDQNEMKDAESYHMHNRLREVLGTIVTLCSPLSMDALAILLDMPTTVIAETLTDLHTIIHIPSQTSRPIRLHHTTLRGFLFDKDRCSKLKFWVDEKHAHKTLADNCITLMSRTLTRDLCALDSPGTLAETVDPDRIQRYVPPELQYACLYWVQHYRLSGTRLCDGDAAHLFIQKHFLNWLEAINLMGKSAEMEAIIRLYHALLVVCYSCHPLYRLGMTY